MKKLIFVIAVMFALTSVASALPIISSVDRSGGASGNRPIIGSYNGETDPYLTTLVDGTYIFTDREYTWPSVPVDLVGADYIQTFNSDKSKDGQVTYAVTLSVGCIYAIAVDDRFDGVGQQQAMVDGIAAAVVPAGTFADTGVDLVTSETTPQTLSVFATALPAGTHTFTGYGFGGSHNFMVMGAVPEPATIALLGLGGLALIRRKR
jgi:hypothetical protein